MRLTLHTMLTPRITGGTRGIGARMALALSKAGADLILIQRDTKNTATKDAIIAAGGKADIVVCDLADKAQVGGLIEGIVKSGRVLDVVVNCGESGAVSPTDGAHDRSRFAEVRWDPAPASGRDFP